MGQPHPLTPSPQAEEGEDGMVLPINYRSDQEMLWKLRCHYFGAPLKCIKANDWADWYEDNIRPAIFPEELNKQKPDSLESGFWYIMWSTHYKLCKESYRLSLKNFIRIMLKYRVAIAERVAGFWIGGEIIGVPDI